MYFPVTTTIEEVWQNKTESFIKMWDDGGQITVDKKMWAGEIVIQGVFLSSDEPLDSDYVDDLRTLLGLGAGVTVTARMIYRYMSKQLLTTDDFVLHYNDDEFGYSVANVDIEDGKWPPVVIKEWRAMGETSKDRVEFTIRASISQVKLPRS